MKRGNIGTNQRSYGVVVGLMLAVGGLGGCVTGSSGGKVRDLYVVEMRYYPQFGIVGMELKVTTRLGVPFEVRGKDAAGNHYLMAGTLRKKTAHSVMWENYRTGAPNISEGPGGECEMELGREISWLGTASGIDLGGIGTEVSKKILSSSASSGRKDGHY